MSLGEDEHLNDMMAKLINRLDRACTLGMLNWLLLRARITCLITAGVKQTRAIIFMRELRHEDIDLSINLRHKRLLAITVQ